MKKTLLILSVLFLAISCKKVTEKLDQFTKFKMNYDFDFTLPKNSIINLPISLPTPDIQTNSESTFKSYNTNSDLIQSINVNEIKMNITAPPNQDFSFLKNIKIYMKAEGLNEILIAKKDSIPDDVGTELILDTEGIDVAPYLKKDKISLRIDVTSDKALGKDSDIKIKMEFLVNAKIFGV